MLYSPVSHFNYQVSGEKKEGKQERGNKQNKRNGPYARTLT